MNANATKTRPLTRNEMIGATLAGVLCVAGGGFWYGVASLVFMVDAFVSAIRN